jgi:hypothetical protein
VRLARRLILVALLVWLVAALPATAQEYRGNLYVTVVTGNAEPVIGARCTLTGPNYSRDGESDDGGKIRFTRIEPGTYTLEVFKDGFNIKLVQGIQVLTGQNVEMVATLDRTEVVETVVVTSEAPLVDRRDMGTDTIISPEEVSQIPTARDPWAILSTVPGLQQDRINVGGNQSGQQSNWAGKGDDGFNATWVMDGVEITDLSAEGGSATYFDFNSFQEIGFRTGGGNFEQLTPGQQLSFVTKQGANRITGSLGLLLAEQDWQADTADYQQPNGAQIAANEIRQTFEKNFEIGGPIKKDVAWYWFGFNQNDISLLLPGPGESQLQDNTRLQNMTAKVNGTATTRGTWKVFYTMGDKNKFGRNAGPTRPQPTTWDQEGPSPITTVDFSWFFTPNFEVSLQYGHVTGGFQLIPQGLTDEGAEQVLRRPGLIWDRSYLYYVTDRPTDSLALRANWFTETGSLNHELKFGFKYKTAEVRSWSNWGLAGVVADQEYAEAWIVREHSAEQSMDYTSFWAGDTMLLGNWTFNVGVLYQVQEGDQVAGASPANPSCPTCLPAINFQGAAGVVKWEDLLPRLGVTYTIPTVRRQLVRFSYSQYVDQLGSPDVGFGQPNSYAELDYAWTDLNGDENVQGNEIDTSYYTYAYNVDPANPTRTDGLRKIDPELEAPRVEEYILGYEIEVMRNFNLGVNFTYRKRDRDLWDPIQDLTNGGILPTSAWAVDGVLNDTIQCYDTAGPCNLPGAGVDYSVTGYSLQAVDDTNAWRQDILTNRSGYDEEFNGIELTATRRLSNKWMLRGFVAWNDWTKNIAPEAIQAPSNLQGDTTKNGSVVTPGGSDRSGAFADVFFGTATWQYNINGLYQLPANFTVSWNLNGRQGYALPMYTTWWAVNPDGQNEFQDLQIQDADTYRMDDVHVFDLGLSYLINLPGNTAVDLRLDAFNLINADTILQLQASQGFLAPWAGDFRSLSSAGQVNEVISPRIFRLGARVTF